MPVFKTVFRDYFRHKFKRNKPKTIHDISLWKTSCLTIEQRENKLGKLLNWCNNNIENTSIKNPEAKFDKLIFLDEWVEKTLQNHNNKDVEKLFSLFNKRKYLTHMLSNDLKNTRKIISLKAYCNLSSIFLREYNKTNNIQFLNTSLKINDFLLSCQIHSKNPKTNGAIPDFFPSYYKGFNINKNLNVQFASNIKQELLILEQL